MNIKATIDGKEISITLTKEQLADINRQQNTISKPEDINSYEDACKVLNIFPIDNVQVETKIRTIIRATNFLDNGGKVWIPNWSDSSQYKYYPYFEKRVSGWAVDFNVSYFFVCSGLGSYFKSSKTALLIAKKFLDLYVELIEN